MNVPTQLASFAEHPFAPSWSAPNMCTVSWTTFVELISIPSPFHPPSLSLYTMDNAPLWPTSQTVPATVSASAGVGHLRVFASPALNIALKVPHGKELSHVERWERILAVNKPLIEFSVKASVHGPDAGISRPSHDRVVLYRFGRVRITIHEINLLGNHPRGVRVKETKLPRTLLQSRRAVHPSLRCMH